MRINMKKVRRILLTLGFLCIIFVCGTTFYIIGEKQKQEQNKIEQEAKEAKNLGRIVSIDGKVKKFPKVEETPYVTSGISLMYPLSRLQEDFNCGVSEYTNGKIRIEKGKHVIIMWEDCNQMLVDYSMIYLRDNVVKKNGITFVPMDQIAEALDYSVFWDEKKEEISFYHLVADELPKRYDYRLHWRDTKVKDQGNLGTCWAFASLSAIETSLMPKEKLEFSVDHMSLNSGFPLGQNEGGEYNMAVAYLSSWKGPVLEEDDPYNDGKTNKEAKAYKHLQEARIIKEKDYKGIKEAIIKYGGVQSSMYTSLKNSYSYSRYYNKEKAAYYFYGDAKSNHDIVIVGWDDDYPKENFNREPQDDGAFICKNSWGSEFGIGGYFYVSYFDSNIGKTNVVYSKVEEKDNYDFIYQSDLLGWIGQLGYKREKAYFANVYETKGKETLKAVSFYATGEDTQYEVYVVRDFRDTQSFKQRELVAVGEMKEAGYYTIELEGDISFKKKEKFAIMVKITTPNVDYPIAVEYNSGYRTRSFDISDGEGYISLYGNQWTSVEKNQGCNLCLKAFTNKSEK